MLNDYSDEINKHQDCLYRSGGPTFSKDMQKSDNPEILKPNCLKTQLYAFHLKNDEASRTLQVSWNCTSLEHCTTLKHLGVTLDCTLIFNNYYFDAKQKIY